MKVIRLAYHFSCLVLLGAVVGCSKANEQASSPVVFTYSGGSYTESQLEADIRLREFLFRESVGNRKGDMNKVDENLAQLKAVWRGDALAKGVLLTSVQLQASRDGLRPSDEQRAAAEAKYEQGIGGGVCDFSALQKKATVAGVRDAFDVLFERELALSVIGDAIVHGDTGFRETNVWIFLTNATNAQRRAEAKNVELYQLATNVVKRLRTGEDFNEVYDESCNLEPYEKDEARAPAEYDLSDFPGEEGKATWEALKALPDGGVGDVLEMDEGLVVYKVFEHIEKSAQTEQFALKLGKIVVRRVVVPDIPKPEEARKDVKAWFAKEAVERKMKEAVLAANIDLGPAATNLSPQLRQQLAEMGIIKKTKEENDASE